MEDIKNPKQVRARMIAPTRRMYDGASMPAGAAHSNQLIQPQAGTLHQGHNAARQPIDSRQISKVHHVAQHVPKAVQRLQGQGRTISFTITSTDVRRLLLRPFIGLDHMTRNSMLTVRRWLQHVPQVPIPKPEWLRRVLAHVPKVTIPLSAWLRPWLRRAAYLVRPKYRRFPVLARLGWGMIALLMFSTALIEVFSNRQVGSSYNLSAEARQIIGEPVPQLAKSLQFDASKAVYTYNGGYKQASNVAGQVSGPKFSASFDADPNKGSIITDPVNQVSIGIKPDFKLKEPQQDQNRLVYPFVGRNAQKVYTLGARGVKEDIILSKKQGDTLVLRYNLELPAGTEPRMESDGSLGIYGVTPALLGDVTTGGEGDAELLRKARENGEKNTLLFSFPAPFIRQSGARSSGAMAWFSLEGNTLSLHAAGLNSASYPLSIDPTVYVETASKLMRGNNETNVDFDTTNDLIQKSPTTGARINGWVDSVDMSAGLWDHSMATAGGFVYRAGGRIDPTMPYIVGSQSTQVSTASGSFPMNMPTDRPSGDLYVAVISRVGTGTITPPSGWLLYSTGTNATTTTRDVAVYYKVGGTGEPATYTWSNSASVQWTGVILRIKGFNSGSPISATTAATTGTATSSSPPVFPTVTPAHDATLIIRSVGINEVDPTEYTWLPTGHTKVHSSTSIADTASSTALVVATMDVPPLNAVSSGTQTLAQDGILTGNYGAITFAVRPETVTAGYQSTVEWAQFHGTTSAIQSPNPGSGQCSGWCTNATYNLPANRVGMSLVAYNGYLYALGGTPDGTAASSVSTVWIAKLGANGEPQLWHPTGGTPGYWFVSTQTLPAAASYTAVAAYKNRIYLVGGRDTAGNSISTVHYADLLPTGDIGAWSTTGMQDLTTPTARYGHSIHVYNDYMYILGGNNNGTLRNTVYYSKLTSSGGMNTWTATNNFTTARSSFGGTFSAVWGAYIYLAGGCTALSSGRCSTIASDVQLASINADGSLSPWNSIATLSNQRIGHTFMAWQGGLYRAGGCNRQNTTTGVCYAVHRNVEFGAVNPPGDASTVSNSEPSGTSPCSGTPINCDLPTAGDSAGQGGQMSSMVVINNGFIYNIGGCTDISGTSECSGGTAMSGNVSYAALNSLGQMVAPANCPTPNTSYGLWCVDATNRINGTAGVGAATATVFNNVIYVVGGTNGGGTWTSNIYSVLVNADGSLSSNWTTIGTGTSGLPGTFQGARTDTGANTNLGSAGIGYGYAFTRANPSGAGSTPGHLYYLGGCVGTAGIGCSGYSAPTPAYSNQVYKCNISTSGGISGCTTTNQMQLDADITAGATGSQGIGLMSGTVYANRVYLVGGACQTFGTLGPCRNGYSANREDAMYARIDSSNNIVDNSTGSSSGNWAFATAKMNPIRRRAVAFGYNGYIYSLAGYSGTASLQDLLFAKIDVSTGDLSTWGRSGVVVTPRWDLRAIVSNGYVYAIGGCGTGAAPDGCTALQPEVQTFQLYNNDSGTPVSFAASANQFATDRMGASSAVLNGYLYVAGGCVSVTDCTDATNSVQYTPLDAYGGLSTAWSAGGNLPADRAWGQLEAVGGTLYYVGGQSDTDTDEQSTVYYTTGISSGSPTWSGSVASNGLPDARTQFSAAVWDDRIYVTGGLNGSAAASTTTYVSPKLTSGGDISSAWTTSTSFNVARSGHATIAYANNIYVLGGYTGTNYLNDVQFATLGYKTGTISQTGSAVTGSGTTWTAAMIGMTLQYRDGETATILTVPSATSMTVSVPKTLPALTGYTILDGSVGTWSYTTSLPEPIRQADGFAANGYMYLVGGRSNDGDCIPNTLQAPISANTTIAVGNNPTGVGEWYETNVKYTGDRYGAAVSYYGGKMYAMGGACEKTPTVTSVNTQSFNTDATAHNVTMPAVVEPGDLLIVLFSSDGNAAVATPGGWTAVSTQTRGTNIRGSVFAKDATGSEDGLNVDFSTNPSFEQASAQVYRIPASNWEGNIASVSATNVDPGGTSNAPNPPNHTPAWGTANNLWLTYVAGSQYATVNSYSTDTTNGVHTTSTGGAAANRASTSSSRRELRAASYDPAAYGMPSTSNGVSFTIAIRPPAFAYTGADRTIQTALYSQPQVASYSRLIDTDTDVFPTSWLMNGLDNSIGARWQARYRSMHDINPTLGGSDSVLVTPPSTYQLQQNPYEDCGTSTTMPVMTTWGQSTAYGNVSLGDIARYVPFGAPYTTGTITQSGTTVTGSGTSWTSDMVGHTLTYADGTTTTISAFGSATSLTVSATKSIGSSQAYAIAGNINCARYFYFEVSIDASQTFGFPEDVNRGPTISDLSLFFTSDPSKRLLHGKTFTGGEQQPLDAPCRQSVDPDCSLP